MSIDRVGPDGDKTVIVAHGKFIADVAISMRVYVDNARSCFLKTVFASACFASHLTIYNHVGLIISLVKKKSAKVYSVDISGGMNDLKYVKY